MTRLILIRHGESLANQMGVFAGHTDFELSELGMKQAEKTAEYICSHYSVNKVAGSDLKRAYHTAERVAFKCGLAVEGVPELREIYAGAWEGLPFTTLISAYKEPYRIWLEDIGNAVCTEGESVRQLQSRVVKALTQIAETHEGENVVIGTHATPIRAFQCFCEKRELGEMKDIPWVSNASVTVADYVDGEFILRTVGYDEHLGDVRTKLPVNV